MDSPTFKAAPTVAEMVAVECLFDRAARITQFGRSVGTLPPILADLRRQALVELRAARHSAGVIAARVGIARARVFQLTKGGVR